MTRKIRMTNYTNKQIKKALDTIIKDAEPKVKNGLDNSVLRDSYFKGLLLNKKKIKGFASS